MTTELTVEQKIRQSLTGDPHGEPVFASQGGAGRVLAHWRQRPGRLGYFASSWQADCSELRGVPQCDW